MHCMYCMTRAYRKQGTSFATFSEIPRNNVIDYPGDLRARHKTAFCFVQPRPHDIRSTYPCRKTCRFPEAVYIRVRDSDMPRRMLICAPPTGVFQDYSGRNWPNGRKLVHYILILPRLPLPHCLRIVQLEHRLWCCPPRSKL